MNYARRDLCGGCPVMGIPTAIKSLTGSAHRRPLPISRMLLGVTGAASEKLLLKKLLLVRLERFQKSLTLEAVRKVI